MVLKAIALIAGLGMLAQIALPSACTNSTTQPTVQAVIAGVQTACSFIPTAQTIENIENANKTITQITQIVQIVCGAVVGTQTATNPPASGAAPGADAQVATVDINGQKIAIVGHFVSK